MSKMKQIDELTDKLVPQVLHKIYKIVDREMEYSDIRTRRFRVCKRLSRSS